MGSQFDAGQPIIDRVQSINNVTYQCYNNVPDHMVPYVWNPI